MCTHGSREGLCPWHGILFVDFRRSPNTAGGGSVVIRGSASFRLTLPSGLARTRQVVVGAFADKGVVRLLAKKMKLCKQGESRRACTHTSSARSRKKARSACKEANGAARTATAGAVLQAPSHLEVKSTTSDPSTGKVDCETSQRKIVQDWRNSFSARTLEKNNTRELPFDEDAGASGAQQRLLVRDCDEPSTPAFATDSNAESSALKPPRLERGKREDVGGRARITVCKDAEDGCLGHQKTLEIIRDSASGDDAKGKDIVPDAGTKANDETGGETKELSPLHAERDDRPSFSCTGVGDEGTTAIVSLSHEEGPQRSSTRGYHRTIDSWSTPATTMAELTGATPGGTGTTNPPSSAGVKSNQSLDASTAATRSPLDMFVESHDSSVEGELGSLLTTFERQVEHGAEVVRRIEEAAKLNSALHDNAKFNGGYGKAESPNTNTSTMTSPSTSSEDNLFADIFNHTAASRDVTGTAEETEQLAPEPETIGATPGEADTGRDREPERTESNLSGTDEQAGTDRGDSGNGSLPAAGEQTPSPDTNTTVDADNEDYEFTFDDEEMVVGQKSVQFTDESLWSTHEVRACFEQHELGELFYTTAELDAMLEEAESDEALERSDAVPREKLLDDTAVAVGGGSGSLLSFGGSQAPKRGSNSAEQGILFETFSFDDEDSDYYF